MKWKSLRRRIKKERKIVKNSWFDCLVNCVPNPIKKITSNFKDKVFIIYKLTQLRF